MNKSYLSAFFGILFIFAGLGYLGNNVGLWHFSVFFAGWWALALALYGFIRVVISYTKNQASHSLLWIVITLIALYYFLRAQGWIHFDLESLIVPLLMIIIGLFLLFPKLTK